VGQVAAEMDRVLARAAPDLQHAGAAGE